jgi:hypothetical protein
VVAPATNTSGDSAREATARSVSPAARPGCYAGVTGVSPDSAGRAAARCR